MKGDVLLLIKGLTVNLVSCSWEPTYCLSELLRCTKQSTQNVDSFSAFVQLLLLQLCKPYTVPR